MRSVGSHGPEIYMILGKCGMRIESYSGIGMCFCRSCVKQAAEALYLLSETCRRMCFCSSHESDSIHFASRIEQTTWNNQNTEPLHRGQKLIET
jgi:hypothetical protein